MNKTSCLKTLCCLMIAFLCFTKSGLAQQGSAKSLRIEADKFSTAPDIKIVNAAYNVIVSKRFNDINNNARFGDPSGQSDLDHVVVNNRIDMDNTNFGSMVISNGGAYSVNLEGFSGDARLGAVHAGVLTMDDSGAGTDYRRDGKFVYDIAEGIDVESGDVCDVVVINKYKDISVTRSTVKFDTKVAGVISEDPKIYMGSHKDNKPLALAGIVKCNVNTENGPIKKGDILVTSSEPGYAMKAADNQILPGMVVGSALDELAQGKGKIYILIN